MAACEPISDNFEQFHYQDVSKLNKKSLIQ